LTEVKAVVLRSHDGPFTVETLTLGEPRANEVVVRVVAVGICHTDLLARELPPEYFPGPIVYGHEGAGIVEYVGPAVTKVAPGDHVVLSFRSCGACKSCLNGHPAYCLRMAELNTAGKREDGTTAFRDADGNPVGSHYFGQSSFASVTIADESSVVKVDPSLDLTKLCPLGCGVQTGAGAVFNVFSVGARDSIVVAGAGALGLTAVMAAKDSGAGTIIAIDRHKSRLELAAKFGATHLLDLPVSELAAAIVELTGGGADYALDLTGNCQIIRACFDGLNWLGTFGLCGVGFGDITFDLAGLMGGRSIKTVIEGDAVPEFFIPHLIDLNEQGRLPYDELITTFPVEQVNEAVAASQSGEVVKAVLLFP
jgi:aryl-alcohol dehydrogenase